MQSGWNSKQIFHCFLSINKILKKKRASKHFVRATSLLLVFDGICVEIRNAIYTNRTCVSPRIVCICKIVKLFDYAIK